MYKRQIETCGLDALDAEDAAASGYSGPAALKAMLGEDDGNPVYRIAIDGLEPDERVALGASTEPSPREWEVLNRRFARWDGVSPGYFPAVLHAIGDRPGVAATELAVTLGVDKPAFKRDVRKLKELGLTESLDVGYRLSPRGQVVLAAILARESS